MMSRPPAQTQSSPAELQSPLLKTFWRRFWYTEKVLFIVLVQMHFIQCEQFSDINVTSYAFQQICDLNTFPECFRGPHAVRGPVIRPHWTRL